MIAPTIEDEEPLTRVLAPAPLANEPITSDLPAPMPHDASIHDRPTLPEALPRDTIVDASPSFLVRACARLCSIGKRILMVAQRQPRLSDHIPPVPGCSPPAVVERAESMLLEIMRAPPEYVEAVILIARATQALRKRGDDVFAEGFVAFALSRMPTDEDGTVSIKRLREHVREMPAGRSLVPVLLRLEEQGVVALETSGEQAPGISDVERTRVRLLVVP